MTDRIDLTDPIREICKRLGFDYNNVTEIVLRPATAEVTATVLRRNENGNPYLEEDETGKRGIATAKYTFETTS